MSDREKAVELLNDIPDYKIGYIVSYLQGYLNGLTDGEEIPNADTIAAMEELENGGGECFDTLDELWKSLEE